MGQGARMKVYEQWMYRNPEEIADRIRAKARREDERAKEQAEWTLRMKRRRIRALVKLAMRGVK